MNDGEDTTTIAPEATVPPAAEPETTEAAPEATPEAEPVTPEVAE